MLQFYSEKSKREIGGTQATTTINISYPKLFPTIFPTQSYHHCKYFLANSNMNTISNIVSKSTVTITFACQSYVHITTQTEMFYKLTGVP